MNETVQYRARVSPQSTGVPERSEFPIAVSEGLSLRLRYFEARLNGLVGSDNDIFVAVTKVNGEVAKASNELLVGSIYLAAAGWTYELASSGAAAIAMVVRVDLWDMDYRVVMPPTIHFGAVGTGQAMHVFLAGEMVRTTQGQRNAIIAWQGGLH